MDLAVVLRKFADELHVSEYNEEATIKELESLYPDIMLIVQKNEDLFTKTYTLFQLPLSEMNHDIVWKHLPVCLFVSFTSGNVREKLNSLLSIAKNVLSANQTEHTDEISRILNDEKAQSSIQEFLEYCTNTRIARVFNEILTNLDVSEFESLLENPHEFMDIARNPEHPMVQKFVHKFQTLLKQRVERGEISQGRIQEDIEGIKAKLTSIFGSVLNDAIGGRRSEVSSTVLVSNSPEARRQRMIARLQRKHREKTQS
jgi:uncharacterized membrane protein